MYVHIIIDAVAVSNSSYGKGSGPMLVNSLQCTGTESTILECALDADTLPCIGSQYAGVQCRCRYCHNLLCYPSNVVTNYMQCVLKVPSDWLEVPLPMKVVLNCATPTSGAQSVMMDGTVMMLVWPVDKLDSHLMVILDA